jgi:deaminated glutathione amidase
MSKITAAAIQLNSQPDLDHNLEQVSIAIQKAAEQNAALVALPENFAFLGDEKEKQNQAEKISNAVERYIPEWAAKHGIYIIAGGYPVRAKSGKVYNRAVVVAPNGEMITRYDKIHLFDVAINDEETYRESDTVEAGKPDPVVCDLQFEQPDQKELLNLKIGLSICYDLRFPELYRSLADLGADIITLPAAFTLPTGEAHWEVLLRARAIENSCFIIAPAQTGRHGAKRKTYGHSMIIDPWGTVLADAGTEPGIAIAEIETGYLKEVRKKLPSLKHRVL